MKRSIKEMLRTIAAECKYTYGLTGVRSISPAVMDAVAAVPRDRFVPAGMRTSAYDDCPLPIGHGQTISQPYIVALMTHLLSPEPEDVILEVGAGSGYQAAILAKLVRRVYSVEIIPALAVQAKQRLKKLGYELHETPSHLRENYCCGGGCGEYVIKRSANLRQKAFRIKQREFDATGADAVVTSCANCRINLMIGADNAGWKTPVTSLAETVASRLAD